MNPVQPHCRKLHFDRGMTATGEPLEPPEWQPVNPCDHALSTPYYIGDLEIASASCTEACPTSTYADNAQICHPCPVVGCATCSESACEDCLIFHLGAGGQCVYLFAAVFAAVALFGLCFVLCGALRFCCYGLLSPRNSGVLKEVLAHRRRTKVHDYSLPGNPFYAYDDANVRRQNIAGVGPISYFRFLGFFAALCSVNLLLLVVGYFLPTIGLGTQDLEYATMAHAIGLYAVPLIACLRWMCSQNAIVKADVEEEPHLRNYALVAEGFPKSARSPHEVKAYFESILGFETEGVSIAYDYSDETEFIEDRVGRAIEKADTHLGVYPSELSGLESHVGDSQDSYVLDCLMCSGYAFVVFSREEDREFCMQRFAEIERQVRAGLHKAEEPESDEEEESQALLLKSGPGRGRRARPGQPSGGGPSRAVLFRGKFPIRMGHAPEPCGIQWRNFSVRRGAKLLRAALALLSALLVVLVIAAVMFAPSVLYEMSFINIREPSHDQLHFAYLEQAMVSASLVSLNRLIIACLRRAMEVSGFLQKVNEDASFVVCAFLTVLLNTTAPLIIASVVAASENTSVTRKLACEWTFQALWMGMVLTEAATVLAPAWRYWSAYFWIRQNRYVSVREAEPLLTAPDFHFATRYVDMLNAFTLVSAMIVCDRVSLYTIGAQCLLFAYGIQVFFMDKYTFLRVTRHTYYASPKLDGSVHYLLAIPMSILFLLPLEYLFVPNSPWINAAIFAASIAMFLIMVRLLQKCSEPRRELTDIPYIEVASLVPYNYFNTNPVHVLRVLHFPSIVVPPIYPAAPGKEYLQGGQFADYDDSVRLRETLMLLAKSPLKGMDDFANPQDFG